MRNAIRLLLLTLLFLTGQQELCASLPKTRVGKNLSLAALPCREEALQVPELRLDNPLLYGESVSGRLIWTHFDPEGLFSWEDAKQAGISALRTATDFTAGIAVGYGQVMLGAAPNVHAGNAAQAWGMNIGRGTGMVQAVGEMFEGGSAMIGGGGATVLSGGILAEVGVPVAVVGGVVAAHGAYAAYNGVKLGFENVHQSAGEGDSVSGDGNSASGGDPSGNSSKDQTDSAKGSGNPNTKRAAARGSKLHSDKPGNLPDQLRQKYPDTEFEFNKPGQNGQDVKVDGGTHPSEYPGSDWHPDADHGDFKPDTAGGRKTFKSDQEKKWPEKTQMLPYNPGTGTLK